MLQGHKTDEPSVFGRSQRICCPTIARITTAQPTFYYVGT